MATKIPEEQCDAISALMYASKQRGVNQLLWVIDIAESCHASIGSTVAVVI